jgi:hypothetical protein
MDIMFFWYSLSDWYSGGRLITANLMAWMKQPEEF